MNNIKKIIMLVFVGILIFFTGFVFAKVADTDHKEVVKTDNTDSDNKKTVNKSNNNSFKQEENIVFLGDSITEYYPIDEIYGDLPIVKSGVSGYQTKDILSRMDKMVYSYNPTKIFLLIGTNDYMYDTKQETIDNTMKNIKKIVNGIRENRKQTKLYIESIFPVNSTISEKTVAKRTNEAIIETNDMIKEYCEENNITYINLFDELTDKDGKFNKDYTNDGLHPNALGYAKITRVLMPYIIETDNTKA